MRPFCFAEQLFSALLLPELVHRLAVYAQGRGGAHLQPLQADLDAAFFAIAVVVLVDARNRLVDLADQLALAVAVAQLQGNVGFLGDRKSTRLNSSHTV